jgi:hypothetical protein
MKVKASSIGKMLSDVDLTLNDTVEINMVPGKVSITVVEDGDRLVREYGVDQDA